MDYRNEWKYICSESQLKMIETLISPMMKKDIHAKDNGVYTIRSVYFDDIYDSFMEENESGVDQRFKIRIRIYNRSSEFIRCEIKYKDHGMTKKESCTISKECCRMLIEGKKLDWKTAQQHKVLILIYLYQKTKLLKPKVIVEYDRQVFSNYAGNVRITFDRNIRCSNYVERFFESNIYAVPLLECSQHVLEVKFDEFLPEVISDVLNHCNLAQSSFSKYYGSRLKMEGK